LVSPSRSGRPGAKIRKSPRRRRCSRSSKRGNAAADSPPVALVAALAQDATCVGVRPYNAVQFNVTTPASFAKAIWNTCGPRPAGPDFGGAPELASAFTIENNRALG